jgi:hypothetical protein
MLDRNKADPRSMIHHEGTEDTEKAEGKAVEAINEHG